MFKKIIIITSLLLISLMAFMSCSKKENKLYVGTNAEFVPFEYREGDQIVGFDDLDGKNVGVVLGYTGDLIVSEMSNVNAQKYGATSEAVIALKSKKVDAVVLDYEPAKQYSAQNQELKLIITDSVNEEYAIAMRKEDTELLKKVNDALNTIKENGTYDMLIEKYFNAGL